MARVEVRCQHRPFELQGCWTFRLQAEVRVVEHVQPDFSLLMLALILHPKLYGMMRHKVLNQSRPKVRTENAEV